ncbi:MAG TPA: hypothetical protein VGK27_07335 [Candidatus Deferrimicrobiaceae bacterium]|jgi:hypothetical protein
MIIYEKPNNSPKGLDLDTAIGYREKGLSYAEIGKIMGASKQSIHELLVRNGIDLGTVASFRSNRGAILAAKQKMLLDNLTDADIKKMAPRDRVLGFGILFDKERLETGKSTANLSGLMQIAQKVDIRESGQV